MTAPRPAWLDLLDVLRRHEHLKRSVLDAESTEDALALLKGFARDMEQIARQSRESASLARLLIADLCAGPASSAEAATLEAQPNQS